MKTHFKVLLLAMMLCAGTNLHAQTADGQTPALETGCDGENGAAFGLCNAYCAAMDCDAGADTLASPEACARTLAQFSNITGREMPLCSGAFPQEGDPCTTENEVINFDPSDGELYGCLDSFNFEFLWCTSINSSPLGWVCGNSTG